MAYRNVLLQTLIVPESHCPGGPPMTTSDQTGGRTRDVGNSTGFAFERGLPGLPSLAVRRSIVVMLSLTIGFTLMAVYGDTVVAGRLGRGIALLGMLGAVMVAPTLISRSLRQGSEDSIFRPD